MEQGKRALIHDGAWANVVGALTSGVLLVGFAMQLGASDQIIGILAAIPFLSQLAQIPAVWLIGALRRRKAITLIGTTAGRAVILALAVLPFLPDREAALWMLIAGQFVIGVLGAIGGCAWNSWIHDLLPKEGLGDFFARRLFWATGLGMAASLLVRPSGRPRRRPVRRRGPHRLCLLDHRAVGRRRRFRQLVVADQGAGAGRCALPNGDAARPNLFATLRQPLRDRNFRRLIVFMVSWNFATNLAAPFIAVYLVQQLGFELGFVVLLSVLSQLANILTLRWWGVVADRFSTKSVLAVCAPVFLACIFALPYTHTPERHALTVPMLVVLHLLMGGASAGIGLGTGTIGLRLARADDATSYLAALGLFGALAAGIAPIVGGALSTWFADKELALLLHWGAGGSGGDVHRHAPAPLGLLLRPRLPARALRRGPAAEGRGNRRCRRTAGHAPVHAGGAAKHAQPVDRRGVAGDDAGAARPDGRSGAAAAAVRLELDPDGRAAVVDAR